MIWKIRETVAAALCCLAGQTSMAQAQKIGTAVFPLDVPAQAITTNYGAHGAGPLEDPNKYLKDKTHIGTDYKAIKGDAVLSPVDGRIVYYQTHKTDPDKNVVVIRDSKTEIDHVLGHFDCEFCAANKLPGTPFPESKRISIGAGQKLGSISDYPPFGNTAGDHLHWGINTKGIVDSSGWLTVPVWGRISGSGHDTNLAEARRLGWADPVEVLELLPTTVVTSLARKNLQIGCSSTQNINSGMGSAMCGAEWNRQNQGRDQRTRQVDPRGNF